MAKLLEAAVRSSPSIFRLPESVRSANPNSFIPLQIGFGPYVENKMENYKLPIAKKAQENLCLPEFDQLHTQLGPLLSKVLFCYDTHLSIDDRGFDRIMLVDALFLLQLFRNISSQMQTSGGQTITLPLPNFDDQNWVDNMFLCDVLKLENQIPLIVFQTILSNSPNENSLLVFLYHFSKSVSPFSFGNKSSAAIGSIIRQDHCDWYTKELSSFSNILNQSHHLLHFTYLAILTSPMYGDWICFHSAKLRFSITLFQKWSSILGYVLDIDFIQQLNDAFGFIHELFELLGILQKQTCAPETTSSPVIPSASQLHKLLFEFKRDGGILCTKFIKDPGTETQIARTSIFNKRDRIFPRMVEVQLPPKLILPEITVNAFTETLFENLLAFETMANINPPVFARYLELMKALIVTPKDLNILKNAKIIRSHDLENDEEVVKLFNRVGNFIFNLKKPRNDNVNHGGSTSESEAKEEPFEMINEHYEKGLKGMAEEIKQCYDSFWIVKTKKYVRKFMRCVVKMVAILGIVFQIYLVTKKLVSIVIGNDNEPSYGRRRRRRTVYVVRLIRLKSTGGKRYFYFLLCCRKIVQDVKIIFVFLLLFLFYTFVVSNRKILRKLLQLLFVVITDCSTVGFRFLKS